MGSKFVRDKNGEIVGMIDDPMGDMEEWEKASTNRDDYDAAANDQYEREHYPIRYWGMKVWKYVCIIAAIVVAVVFLKKQMYGDMLMALLCVVILYFIPMLLIYVLPTLFALYLAIFMGIWHVITMPFTAVIELIKAIKESKKK